MRFTFSPILCLLLAVPLSANAQGKTARTEPLALEDARKWQDLYKIPVAHEPRTDLVTSGNLDTACAALITAASRSCTQAGLSVPIAFCNTRGNPTLLEANAAYLTSIPSLEEIVAAKDAPCPDHKVEATPGSQRLTLQAAGSQGIGDSSTMIGGLADFLADRAAAELSAWVSDQVVRKVCDEEARAGDIYLSLLIPRTCALIDGGEKDLLKAALTRHDTASLQEMLKADTVAFPRHLGEQLIASAERQFTANATDGSARLREAGVLMAIGGRTGELVLDGVDPLAAFANWARAETPTFHAPEGSVTLPISFGKQDGTLQMPVASSLYLVSELLASVSGPEATYDLYGNLTSDARAWRSAARLAPWTWAMNLAHDPAMKLCVKPIQTNNLKGLMALSRVGSSVTEDLVATVEGWLALSRAAQTERRDLAAGLVADTADLLVEVVEGLAREEIWEIDAALQDFRAFGELLHVSADLVRLDLSGALTHAVDFAQVLLNSSTGEGAKKLPDSLQGVLRLGVLATKVAQASTADEVQSALASGLDPVGSYLDKRTDPGPRMIQRGDGSRKKAGYLTILNGYVGLAGGTYLSTEKGESPQGVFWPTATIGPELGIRTGGKVIPNVGLHVELLDLGNLLQARAADATATATLPEVFTPGAHLTLGLGRSPFVLEAGGEWTPSAEQPIRLGGGLVLDLTLLKGGNL